MFHVSCVPFCQCSPACCHVCVPPPPFCETLGPPQYSIKSYHSDWMEITHAVLILAWRSDVKLRDLWITPDKCTSLSVLIFFFGWAGLWGGEIQLLPACNISSDIWLAEVCAVALHSRVSLEAWWHIFGRTSNEIPWMLCPDSVSILDRMKTGDQSMLIWAHQIPFW